MADQKVPMWRWGESATFTRRHTEIDVADYLHAKLDEAGLSHVTSPDGEPYKIFVEVKLARQPLPAKPASG